jgi:hypothetical protein
MVELERMSRFLSSWMARAAAEGPLFRLHPAPPEPGMAEHEFAGFRLPPESPARARWRHLLWEPYLNEAVVAWQENTLQNYDQALEQVLALSELPEETCPLYFMRAGYPLRLPGRRRNKVAVFSPAPRPLRTKSVFNVRYNQLVRKVEELGPGGTPHEDELTEDIRFLVGMIHENVYQIASEPGFLRTARPGADTIRRRPDSHPFLLDPVELFKKAILFDNGTYTIGGGGIDAMFLQVRQLERYYRFQGGSAARRLLATIDATILGWEENKWKVFTGGLVQIAERLREQAAGS